MDERHVKTDINLREGKVSVTEVEMRRAIVSGVVTGVERMRHLTLVTPRQFIYLLNLSRCTLWVTSS